MMYFNVFEKVAQMMGEQCAWLNGKNREIFESGEGDKIAAFRDYERNLEKMGLQFRHDCPTEFGLINREYKREFGDIATTREYAALYLALCEFNLVSDDDDM